MFILKCVVNYEVQKGHDTTITSGKTQTKHISAKIRFNPVNFYFSISEVFGKFYFNTPNGATKLYKYFSILKNF